MTLAVALERTRARAGFSARLARASFCALAAVIVAELGAIAERGVPRATEAGLVLGALLGAVALALLVLGRRPSRTEAARKLDAALAKGSLIETAAETLDGRHGPFAQLVVKDAESALHGSEVARLVPIEPPRALGAGACAALLLLALALGPAAEKPPEQPSLPPLAIDLDPRSGAVGAPPNKKKGTTKVLSPTQAKNAPRFDEAIAKELMKELEKLAPLLATRKDAPLSREEEQAQRALDEGLARGDANAVKEALRALQSAGTAHSAPTLAKAADTITGRKGGDELSGSGGAGTGAGPSTNATGATSGSSGAVSADQGKEASSLDPWRVLSAIDRYKASIE